MIHLFCALPCEAKPLIAHFSLERLAQARTFRMYSASDGRMTLTLTGPGKQNAARATDFNRVFFNATRSDGWLNIGVAGHRSFEVGQAILAHRILDAATHQAWYPQIVFNPPCPTAEVKTLDGPSLDYENKCFDMEAAGFYAAASRFATGELIHSIKIISDNARHPAVKLRPDIVGNLIAGQIRIIERTMAELISLSGELSAIQGTPGYYGECIERWHFTQYERHVLADLLRRWSTVYPDRHPLEHAAAIRQGGSLINTLERILNDGPVNLTKAGA